MDDADDDVDGVKSVDLLNDDEVVEMFADLEKEEDDDGLPPLIPRYEESDDEESGEYGENGDGPGNGS